MISALVGEPLPSLGSSLAQGDDAGHTPGNLLTRACCGVIVLRGWHFHDRSHAVVVGHVEWHTGSMLVAFSISPSGGDNPDASVHNAVAASVRVVRESGLPNRTDSMFTTIEGDWDECMAVVKEATAAVAEYGPRVSLVLKADIRPGHTGELEGKVERLERAIGTPELDPSQQRRGITSGEH